MIRPKRFFDWIFTKIWLDKSEAALPYFNEGEVWWCSLGENVGTEIGGKGINFRRPVIIITKIDSRSFIGMPLTSKIKNGSWYYTLNTEQYLGTAILIQSRYLDSKRLDKRISDLPEPIVRDLRDAYIEIINHQRKSPTPQG